jgi:hypothetical protein
LLGQTSPASRDARKSRRHTFVSRPVYEYESNQDGIEQSREKTNSVIDLGQ